MVVTEKETAANEAAESANCATPAAMLRVLEDVYAAAFRPTRSPLLTPAMAHLLLVFMEQTTTGQERLKAGLPSVGLSLAHKTGSSGTVGGRTLAHNDVGMIRLTDGRHACIVSFITACTEDVATMNHAHAQLAEETVLRLFAQREGTDAGE
ncbi:MAG: serine hydrolase [Akkermansia sp.]